MERVPVGCVRPGDVVLLPRRNGELRKILVTAPFDGAVLWGRRRSGVVSWEPVSRQFPVGADCLVRKVERACPLAPRQLEVLSMLASGEVASLKEVAYRMGITLKTAHNHVHEASRVLGTSGRLQTLVVALREGWVVLPAREGEAA